jgi:hypothetical protein
MLTGDDSDGEFRSLRETASPENGSATAHELANNRVDFSTGQAAAVSQTTSTLQDPSPDTGLCKIGRKSAELHESFLFIPGGRRRGVDKDWTLSRGERHLSHQTIGNLLLPCRPREDRVYQDARYFDYGISV